MQMDDINNEHYVTTIVSSTPLFKLECALAFLLVSFAVGWHEKSLLRIRFCNL